MYKSQDVLLGLVGLGMLDMLRRKREKQGADAKAIRPKEKLKKKKLVEVEVRLVCLYLL